MKKALLKELIRLGASEEDAKHFIDAIIEVLRGWHVHDILTLLEEE